MTDLAHASQRFQRALEHLDRAASPLVDSRRSLMEAEARVTALVEERERLVARIAELEEETRALARLSEAAERRVDEAIGEVRSALGR